MPKRTADDLPKEEAGSSDAFSLLDIHLPETVHAMHSAADQAVEDDPELCPGVNCCAVCAAKTSPGRGELLACPDCKRGGPKGRRTVDCAGQGNQKGRLLTRDASQEDVLEMQAAVVYCNEEHLAKDSGTHKQVCGILAHVAALEAIDVTDEAVQKLMNRILTAVSRSVASLPAGNWAPSIQGWQDILPADYLKTDARPTKRARTTTAERCSSDVGATCSQDIQQQQPGTKESLPTTSTRKRKASNKLDKRASSSHEPANTQLAAENRIAQDAVLGVCSEQLSYPLTLLHELTQSTQAQQLIQAKGALGHPLVVTVLGASPSAELACIDMWKVLEGAAPCGLLLQFVGPDVPSEQHLHVEHISSRVTASFYQGEYISLADEVVDGSAQLPAELKQLPDMFVGFNMGLTCPDYDWLPTVEAVGRVLRLKAMAQDAEDSKDHPPVSSQRLFWLVTTNSQIESALEDELLTSNKWSSIRPLARNPFLSLQILQSGTLGNDLYRKNAWVACYELSALPKKEKLGKRVRRWLRKLGQPLKKLTGALFSR